MNINYLNTQVNIKHIQLPQKMKFINVTESEDNFLTSSSDDEEELLLLSLLDPLEEDDEDDEDDDPEPLDDDEDDDDELLLEESLALFDRLEDLWSFLDCLSFKEDEGFAFLSDGFSFLLLPFEDSRNTNKALEQSKLQSNIENTISLLGHKNNSLEFIFKKFTLHSKKIIGLNSLVSEIFFFKFIMIRSCIFT